MDVEGIEQDMLEKKGTGSDSKKTATSTVEVEDVKVEEAPKKKATASA